MAIPALKDLACATKLSVNSSTDDRPNRPASSGPTVPSKVCFRRALMRSATAATDSSNPTPITGTIIEDVLPVAARPPADDRYLPRVPCDRKPANRTLPTP